MSEQDLTDFERAIKCASINLNGTKCTGADIKKSCELICQLFPAVEPATLEEHMTARIDAARKSWSEGLKKIWGSE